MINIYSYQVFDNCIGECVIPATRCAKDVETDEEVENYRTEIKLRHKSDVEEHRKKFENKKLTDKQSAITVYFQYRMK